MVLQDFHSWFYKIFTGPDHFKFQMILYNLNTVPLIRYERFSGKLIIPSAVDILIVDMHILVIFGILLCTVEAQLANPVCCSGSGATVPTKLDATCKPTYNGARSWIPMTCSTNGTSCQPYTCVVKDVGITVSTTYYQSCAAAAATANRVLPLRPPLWIFVEFDDDQAAEPSCGHGPCPGRPGRRRAKPAGPAEPAGLDGAEKEYH